MNNTVILQKELENIKNEIKQIRSQPINISVESKLNDKVVAHEVLKTGFSPDFQSSYALNTTARRSTSLGSTDTTTT